MIIMCDSSGGGGGGLQTTEYDKKSINLNNSSPSRIYLFTHYGVFFNISLYFFSMGNGIFLLLSSFLFL